MLYTRQEAAEILGVSLATLDKLRYERKIGYYQMHSRCRIKFSQAHLDRFLKALEVTPCREFAVEDDDSSNAGTRIGKKKSKANRL